MYSNVKNVSVEFEKVKLSNSYKQNMFILLMFNLQKSVLYNLFEKIETKFRFRIKKLYIVSFMGIITNNLRKKQKKNKQTKKKKIINSF